MNFKCDVLIIGGGPSGLLTGSLISKRGFKTIILEEHGEIGKPEQCTGLVSWRIGKIPEEIVLNTIETARFCFKKYYFEVSSPRRMLVINRMGYDKYLAENAVENMVEIRTGERAVGLKNGRIITNRENSYYGKILVGADGPNSITARLFGLKQPKNLFFALQCVAKGFFEKDVVELRFEPEFSKNGFAWVVPLSANRARVGLATRDNPSPRLATLLKKLGLEAVDKPMGDSIRFGLMNKTVVLNTILVGDAACQVKPFSFGGLVYGRICSEIAGEACVKALEEDFLEEDFLIRIYESMWKKKIGKSLKKGLWMRRFFNFIRIVPFSFRLIDIMGLNNLAEKTLDPDFLKIVENL
ncbi:MAG: NAD(P)/FAD-dependent oxidoreductase [Nitrososphaerota archaeon]|nr:NAD(P)/FAD-dependent oxidoreductase [Leptospiraceae bacterium]MDW8033756.1 NAD(P)/FAD-dependent oxidoreductase [Nitrososphaerota archaeon]